ncbi:MAG: hypothetical protein LQ343_006663 [Gyalolechia ehrenbergii]|nr:MAG: hypothetical protein LQ343_006663 [Gyalolechia ehrenbergii]
MTITDLQAEDRPQRVSKLKAQSHTRKSPRLNPGVEDQSTQLNSPIANEVLQVTTPSRTPPDRSRKRARVADDLTDVPSPKRTQAILRDFRPTQPALRETRLGSKAFNYPVESWLEEKPWSKEYFRPDTMSHLQAKRKSTPSLRRKRSDSSLTASSNTPSDQKPREEKSKPYQDPRYRTLLETKGSYMDESMLDVTDKCKKMCRTLLQKEQTVPDNSLFRDDVFKKTCRKLKDRNEARVVQDIARLIVPSAESLATLGVETLEILIESVNEGWNNSVPLTGTRPQPDYAVGFSREAFTDVQLKKLAPFIGEFLFSDQSFFMATYYMYFPFLTSEVKCGASAIEVADRQNAHSMTLAVRAIVELFRLVKREQEINREILAFSVSHDHQSVRIYGHYAIIDGPNTTFYRYPIRAFDFTELDGEDKWTAYKFTKSVYNSWAPTHFKRICSAIDKIPLGIDWSVQPFPQDSALPQHMESQHLSGSVPNSVSRWGGDDTSDIGITTPETSLTQQGASKKQKGNTMR